MTEIDSLKYEVKEERKAFDKLHKRHMDLLKQQGELEKENEQLKSDNKDCAKRYRGLFNKYIKLQKENKALKTFKDKLFALIDARIEIYKHKPFMAPVSAPLSVNFDEDSDRLARLSELEQLKKELSK